MKFSTRNGLNSHQRSVHAGENFKCEHCPKDYNKKADLNRHVKINHEDRLYFCKNCGDGFGRKDILKKHFVRCKNKSKMLEENKLEDLEEEMPLHQPLALSIQ